MSTSTSPRRRRASRSFRRLGGYVWTPGYWDWRGGRHYWVGGHWVRARPRLRLSQPGWVNEGGHWRLTAANGRAGDRDRHDGVPNALDRHPDNPYRR